MCCCSRTSGGQASAFNIIWSFCSLTAGFPCCQPTNTKIASILNSIAMKTRLRWDSGIVTLIHRYPPQEEPARFFWKTNLGMKCCWFFLIESPFAESRSAQSPRDRFRTGTSAAAAHRRPNEQTRFPQSGRTEMACL